MVRRIAGWMAVVLSLTAISAAPPDTADEWLHRLASDDWHERQKAVDELVRLGRDAHPLLEELLRDGAAGEVRKNLERAIDQIEYNRLLGPSRITLHVKDAAPREVFAELSRQCFAPLPTAPSGLWDEGEWPKVTLDLDRRPFWQVMRQLGERVGVQYLPFDQQGVRLSRGRPRTSDGVCIDGAFLVTADVLSSRNRLTIDLSVYGEPKILVLRTAALKIERAEDDRGHKLAPQLGRRAFGPAMFGRRSRAGTRRMYLPFVHPVDDASRIARFKGVITVAVQDSSETWEVRDPLTMTPLTRLVDWVPVTLSGMTRAGTGDAYELRVSLPFGWTARTALDEMEELIRDRLRVFDADGHALTMGTIDSHGGADGMEVTANFSRAAPAGAPAKLVWDIPRDSLNLDVLFDFKDLPINDPFN